MKINEVIETMRGPNFDKVAKDFGNTNSSRWKTKGKHIGDIEDYKLLQEGIYYSLWDQETLIAYCSLSTSNNEVDDVWVHEQYRGKKLFSMLLWFFKTRLNRTPLMLGSVHSSAMQEVVKGLSRFKKYWFNLRSNEKALFSIDTVDSFYSHSGSTAWRLMLENTGEFNWPKFNGSGFIKESYPGYID